MSSIRKRKYMLRKLNVFFGRLGYIPSEREYNAMPGVPYRREVIKKYLGGWVRMINYLGFYYPKWKEDTVAPIIEKTIAEEEAPSINLDALEEDSYEKDI